MNILHYYYRYGKETRNWNRKREIKSAGNISFANWWREDPANSWFTRYIGAHCGELSQKVRFYSVFGPHRQLEESFDGIKVFFSGENLEEPVPHKRLCEDRVENSIWADRRKLYGDYGAGLMDLSLGFAPENTDVSAGKGMAPGGRTLPAEGSSVPASTYLRFPLWITYLFKPESSYEEVKEMLQRIDLARSRAVKDTMLLSSHDFWGTREDIVKGLSDTCDIHIAGKWHNNTTELWDAYGNDKLKYLSEFRFNICPENVDAPGYTTEKIFDAFRCGAVPIYHGALNLPEPEVIRPEAVLLWNYESDNEEVKAQIRRLKQDDAYYERFMAQPKFKAGAADYVMTCMESFGKALKQADTARR